MVLPPSSNHFQPIHSRTPSAEVKDISSNAFKHSPQTSLSQTFTNNLSFNNSPASFFDQKIAPPLSNPLPTNTNSSKTISPQINPLVMPPNLASTENKIQTGVSLVSPPSQLHAPIPTKPLQFPIPTLTPLINPQLASTIAPPVSLPPPTSLPPPPSTSSLSSGSNPYSARGALNKKVYDTSVPVVSLPPPSFPLGKLPEAAESPSASSFMNNSMPMHLVPSSSSQQPPLLQTMDTSSMIFQPPTQAPSTNVNSTPLNSFQVQNPGYDFFKLFIQSFN